MKFDINQLDEIEYDGSLEFQEALGEYQNSILREFASSPEGKEYIKVDPGMGFWIAHTISYGIIYIGVTIPQMDEYNIDEIITELFPREISVSSYKYLDGAIPELLAFWQFIASRYKLPNAGKIIAYLTKIKPKFNDIMNDSSKFNFAKSFITTGQKADYDMTSQNQRNEFSELYNRNIVESQYGIEATKNIGNFTPKDSLSKKLKTKKKQKRKDAKVSRKKNNKKRKK